MQTQKVALAVVALAAGMLSLLTATPSPARAAGASPITVYPATSHGVVAPASGIPAAAAHAPLRLAKDARSLSAAASAAVVSPPHPATAQAASAARVLHNFNGVSSLDSELTNYRLEFEPPDQGLCEGKGFVLEAVNSAYRIYHTDGTSIEGPFNINDLFNEGGQEFTSDPRCQYDPASGAWFATILFISADSRSSHLDIAVNPSGDPTTLWTEYRIDTTTPGDRGCPCLGDQPHLGIDQHNLYVSADEFSILGPQFNGADIQAFSKRDLIAGAPVHFVRFAHLHVGGQLALTIEPAISSGAPAAEYFMESLDPNHTFDNRLAVWALTHRERVSDGGTPVLSSTVITSEAYGHPVEPPQKGSPSLLDAGDDRMQQVQFIAGDIWGELTSAVTIAGDTAERDGGAWFRLTPRLSDDHIAGASVAEQGYVVRPGAYVIYPALQADSAGRSAMVFTLTSKGMFPSAAFATKTAGQQQFGAPVVAAAGAGPYSRTATRWGDYSWAVLNPLTDQFWLATEYVPPASSQTTDGRRNWGTRVLDVGVG